MKMSLETKTTVIALAVVLLALGSVWALAASIRMLPGDALGADLPEIEVSSAPEVVHEGAQFFATSCTECHGDDAHGDEGPDLHNLAISNARISATIHQGIEGEMPTFAKKYDDKQIGAIVSYLRTLR
jgi:mono/diheme cytochrome c family protein